MTGSRGSAAAKDENRRLRLVDDDVQIDLTETAVGELLLQHMVPRLRAQLRGAVFGGHGRQEAD